MVVRHPLRSGRFFYAIITLLAFLLFAHLATPARAYTHPGIPLTVADLDTLKANLNTEPWKSAYASLTSDSKSQLTYTIQGPFASVSRTPDVNLGQWKGDMQAIYNLARMWYFTGNTAYAQKAHDILLAYANNHTSFDGAEMYLSMGDYAYRLFGGADILRGTWPGWTQADTDTCKAYFENVWWHGNGIDIANPLRSANQGIDQLMAVVGVAVFNDDDVKFAQCLQAYRADITGGLPDSLSNGEVGDSGRDQGHAYGELEHLAIIAEIFWKQGVDVYSDLNNRLLACGEFFSRYNLSINTAYIPFGTKYDYYANIGGSPGSASPDAINILYSAYVIRKGIQAPYMSQYRDTQPENADTFVYRKSTDTSTATVQPPLIAPAASAAITTGFLNSDIGGATPAGGASYSNGTWTVTGAGSDISGNSDSYHYTYKQLTGDFTFVAKVTSIVNTSPYAKAGLVMRDSLSGTVSRRVFLGYQPGTPGSIATQVASDDRGYTANSHNDPDESTHDGVPLPQWLKIQRIGTRVLIFHSDDGANWIPLQNCEYAGWTDAAYVGLSVCSKVNGTLTTATFSDVRITGGDGNEAAKAPATPRFIYAAPGYHQVPLRWLEAAYATSYNVKRATNPGGPYTPVATVTTSSYTDFNVSPNTPFYYVVSAVNPVGESGNSPEEPITTLPLPGYPKLTGTIIGSTGTSGNGAANAFDTDFTTAFDTSTSTGTWVGLDLGSQQVISKLRYVPRTGNNSRMTGGQFQASNTANFSSGVVTFYTVPSAPPYTVYTSQNIADPAGYRYVRYLGPTGGYCNVAEIEFYGYAIGTTPTPASAPTGLLATSLSYSTIELSWTAATGPGYYIVKRATTSGGPYTIVASDLSNPFYRDTGLVLGTSYYYVVTFVTVGGESVPSPEVTPPPAPPSGLVATPNSDQVSLTWVAATGATSYNVKRADTSGGPYTILGNTSGTNFTDITVSNGSTYYYVLSSTNPGGQSVNGSEVSATPAAQNAYWDTTTAAGLANGSGAWDVGTTALWSNTVAGTSNPLLGWFNGNHAFFQTGGTLTATLAGTVRVSSLNQAGTNTTTTITGGTLQIDSDVGLTNGVGSGDKALTINSAVVLNSPNITIDNETTAGTLTLGGLVSEIGGSRALTKTGPGGLSFKGANTFSGGLTITGGQVSNGVNTNLTLFGVGPITLASTTTIAGGNRTLYVANTGFTFNNNFIIQAATQNRLEYSKSATLPLNGTITGGGLFQISTGFNPTIQFNGDVTAFTGTLQFVGNGGSGGATSNYDFTNTTAIGAPGTTIRLESAIDSTNAANLILLRWNPTTTTGATIPLGALTGSFGAGQSASNLIVTNAKSGTAATWQIGALNLDTPFAGIIQDGSGTSALDKVGTGALTLYAAQTYTGATTLDAGTLVVNGSLAAGSAVTVNSTATLAGTGSVLGVTTVNSGGAIAPGSGAAGTLTLAALSLKGGASLNCELATPSTSDKIALTGAYTAPTSGTVTINLAVLSGFGAGAFPLITGAAGISAGSFTLGSTPVGYTFTLSAASGTLTATATAWTPLETWRYAAFGTIANTGTAADSADPDGDGLQNRLEYALGTSPLSANAGPTVVLNPTTNRLEITFTRQRSELTYIVEGTSDLVTWTTIATNPGTLGSPVTVSDTTAPAPSRFLRLRVP